MIRVTRLVLQAILASWLCCAPAFAAHQPLPARELHFGSKPSIGGLYFSDNGRSVVKPATGDVSIPANAYVKLKVNYAGASDLSPLSKLPPDAIQRISFRNLELKNEQLKNIENLTALEELDFEETYVSDKGFDYLRKLKNIHTLDFRATDVTGVGLAKLKPLSRLVALTLNNCNIDDRGLEALAQMKSIERLYIASARITDVGLRKIAPMTQLVCLDISKNKKITDEGIAALCGMKKLQELRVADIPLTFACIPYLKKLDSLHKLTYSTYNTSKAKLEALRKALPHCALLDQQSDVDMDLFAPLH